MCSPCPEESIARASIHTTSKVHVPGTKSIVPAAEVP